MQILQNLKREKIDQRFFGAHTYRRTCYSGDYTGRSILFALINKAKSLDIPIYDSQYVSDLLVDDNVCFGAMAFDIQSGERTVYLADSVIIAAGGIHDYGEKVHQEEMKILEMDSFWAQKQDVN
ncbi:MAG: hypothetical protein Ct9H90mP22_3970 [Gammaproteobacteria bacterium]|nr:MAG: hypothetical protein Ct9H90mP22_3970 [Gammaproteobacteria bacterium]